MSRRDVPPDEMKTPPLDANTADRLLAGAIQPDDAPDGYQRIAALIAVANEPATEAERQDPPPGLAALVTSAEEPADRGPRTRRRSTQVAVAAAVLCLTASSAAAATNNLPDPIQRAVSSVASQIGVSIPEPASPDDITLEPTGPDRDVPGSAPSGSGDAPDQTVPDPAELLPNDRVPETVDEVVPDPVAPPVTESPEVPDVTEIPEIPEDDGDIPTPPTGGSDVPTDGGDALTTDPVVPQNGSEARP
ncbi:MAG: hypothetical protein U5K29_13905 [Acidimicrobiales bacterium]|nr:hypothetical protein [Acidimicrobiales bacterium]